MEPFAGKRGATPQDQRLHSYLVSHSVRDLEKLQELQKVSMQHSMSYMLSPFDSVAILQLLLKLTSAKVAVEVGTFTGFTALGIALGLPAPGGKLYTLDISSEYPAIGRPHWEKAGVADRIEFLQGDAKASLQSLLKRLGPGSVDLAFLDADKVNYDWYYEALLELVRPGGVVVVDNVLWDGAVVDESDTHPETQAIRALNDKVVRDPRVQMAMLKNSDGITVAYKL